MNNAYLILAHHQPRHLAGLIGALDCPEAHFFVHVDKKAQLDAFRALVHDKEKISFCENRVGVHRFDFSMVEATLRLLSMAVRSPRDFDRYCLLSGSDFPIKSNSRIVAALSANEEFIRIDGPANVRRFFLGSRPYPFPMNIGRHILRRFLLHFPRKPFRKIRLYTGSQWWALTRGCISFILDFLRTNKDYFRFMRFAPVPDELFFHSLVKASPFSQSISQDFERGRELPPDEYACHYIDWSAKGVPLPKVLDVEDLPKLLRSSALFARKFHEIKSAELVGKLEETRRG